VNIWTADAPTVAASYHRIEARHPGRFLLGVGVGHPEATSDYRRPYAAVVSYLDELDAAGVPDDRRVLAALGPRMLRLSADRSAGAHPYLTTPEHTRRARGILGPTPLLAPEQHVVVEPEPVAARAIGRPAVAKPYLGLTNYTSNLRTLGFDDADLAGDGSDRLIDALVAHGDPAAVAARLQQHLDAGADQVAVNLLTAPGADPVTGFTALAEVLFG
jgi:probable F420-dependent oxidoreductase